MCSGHRTFGRAASLAGAVKSLHLKADITLRPGRWAWRWPRTRGSRVCSRLGLRRAAAATAWAVPVTGRAFRVRACCHMCLRPCCRTHLLAPAGARIDEAVCVSLTSSCARVPLSVRAERILPCAPACAAHSPPHTLALQMRLKPPQRAPHSVVLWRTLSRRVLWAHVPRRGAIVRLSLGVLSLWSAAYMPCPIGDLWGRLWFIVMHFIFRFRKRKSENSPMCGLISHKT